ncbi:E3 ubiquitin-protein ligase RNF187 [Elephas maximus indicus]|nr:E3 ubiquitin-protein ligase RNF187 [Elephas maximus indicus]
MPDQLTQGRRGAGSGLQGRVPGVQSRCPTGSRRGDAGRAVDSKAGCPGCRAEAGPAHAGATRGGQWTPRPGARGAEPRPDLLTQGGRAAAGGTGGAQRGFASPAPAQAALRHGDSVTGKILVLVGFQKGTWAGAACRTPAARRTAARTRRSRPIGAAWAAPRRRLCGGAAARRLGPRASGLQHCCVLFSRSPRLLPSPRAALAALEDLAAPEAAACAICQRTFRDPVRADCGHQFCRACVVQFWAEEDGPFPCPECADDCWQRAVEPGRPPLSRRLLALEVAAAGSARDAPASEAALQLLCRADGGPLCRACRMAAAPEPPEWEPRWRKALRGKENKGSVEIMRKDLKDARDLHGQAESAAAVWKGHVMDRRKKALTDYKKLRAFFAEEEEHFLQEAEKAEEVPDDEGADSVERFRTLLQAVSELEKKHRNLGLSMLLQ